MFALGAVFFHDGGGRRAVAGVVDQDDVVRGLDHAEYAGGVFVAQVGVWEGRGEDAVSELGCHCIKPYAVMASVSAWSIAFSLAL